MINKEAKPTLQRSLHEGTQFLVGDRSWNELTYVSRIGCPAASES